MGMIQVTASPPRQMGLQASQSRASGTDDFIQMLRSREQAADRGSEAKTSQGASCRKDQNLENQDASVGKEKAEEMAGTDSHEMDDGRVDAAASELLAQFQAAQLITTVSTEQASGQETLQPGAVVLCGTLQEGGLADAETGIAAAQPETMGVQAGVGQIGQPLEADAGMMEPAQALQAVSESTADKAGAVDQAETPAVPHEDMSGVVKGNGAQDQQRTEGAADASHKPAAESEASLDAARVNQTRQQPGPQDRKETQNQEDAPEGQQLFHASNVNPREYFFRGVQQEKSIPVRTTPSTMADDLGQALAARMPSRDGTLTIDLEPASLGKLTIKVLYEEGRATVSILSSNPKTLEILNQKASELASILEDRTGQETVVYTQPPEQEPPFDERQGDGRRDGQQQERQERKGQEQQESFAQQLRLGLV